MGVLGVLTECGDQDSLSTRAFRLLDAIETALCVEDWRAYRAWAWGFRHEYAVDVEPCDAWFTCSPDAEPWIDEWNP
jgi:hypothetical protein